MVGAVVEQLPEATHAGAAVRVARHQRIRIKRHRALVRWASAQLLRLLRSDQRPACGAGDDAAKIG